MHACIFCGALAPANYKNLRHGFVLSILQQQHAAGINDPIVNCMRNRVFADCGKQHQMHSEVEEVIASDAEEDGPCDELQGTLHSCMCCYYWVARRLKQNIVPLPMQNLLWFVRTLEGCERKRCDSRILLRLLKAVTESGNMYACLFHENELEGMAAIKLLSMQARGRASAQGDEVFCVKKQLASLWHANNGQTLLLGHAHAADLLR